MKLSEVQLLCLRATFHAILPTYAGKNYATVEIHHYLGIEFVGSYNNAHSKVGVVDRLPRVSKISCYSTVT